mgnify:CR=1 FL=1
MTSDLDAAQAESLRLKAEYDDAVANNDKHVKSMDKKDRQVELYRKKVEKLERRLNRSTSEAANLRFVAWR